MSELLTIIDRMKFLRDQVLHLNQRDFAARISVSGGLIGQIETGKIGVSPKLLRTLEERFNVSREWLESGVEPMFQTLQAGFAGRHGRVEPPDYTRPGHGDLRFRDNDYVFIRRVDLSVSAGNGTSDVEGPDTGSVALPTSWCSRAGINSDVAVLVKVAGDSMSPTIADGSFVLIHLMEKTVDQPGIYAFTRDGEAFIKRLIPSDLNGDGRPGTIMVLSDNTAFAPYALTGHRLNELRVVGRVRAIFTTL